MKMKNVKIVILAEAVLFFAVFIGFVLLCGERAETLLGRFLDFPSLYGIVIISIAGLLIMKEWKDFVKAFSVGKKHYSLMELKNIVEAVGTCQKLVLYAGLMEVVVSLVTLCSNLPSVELFFPNLSVIGLAGFYTIIFEYLLLPLKSNAVKCMNEEMDIDYEE